MILLNSDVAWFCPRPSNLVLLLKNNVCETSTSGGVAKNVSDIVVTKQQQKPRDLRTRPSLHCKFFPRCCVWGTEKVRQKVALAAETSALYERRPTACQAKTGNRGCKEPIACMRHRAGKEQIV